MRKKLERFVLWFAWANLIASSVLWAITQATNTTEPPIVLALSWYAIWQGSLIFIVSAFINRKAD